MSTTVVIAIVLAVLVALLFAYLLCYRLMIPAVFRLLDLFPPYRPKRRYRSQSTPERYASLRKLRNGS